MNTSICPAPTLNVGEKLHGFHVLRIEQIPDVRVTAYEIEHEKTGAKSNTLDSYQCPRCGDAMARVVDPLQTHIWYETCSGCNGSYLDAGELRDLSSLTISDIFKRIAGPER